jgi:membrane-associated protein TcaA
VGTKKPLLFHWSRTVPVFHQQYVINVYSFNVKTGSNLDNTQIFLNGKKIKTIKEKDSYVSIGKFLPGAISLKAIYKGEYTSLDSTTKVDFSDAENNSVHVDVKIDGHFVYIYSNGDEAEIFANGKNTGNKIGDMDSDSFGAVPVDGTVELYAVLNRCPAQSRVTRSKLPMTARYSSISRKLRMKKKSQKQNSRLKTL